ncbi:MAG: DNA-binding domain-containing protein [Coxiellaceae bacterium]|nr:DNA-binding domain-containing protein [Coxiellaceae bacterium]
MSDLAKLQHDFLAAFNQQDESLFTSHIDSKTELTAQQRFEIYTGSITEGIATSLRETYQITEKIVGDEFFTGMAYSYIKQTPSNQSDIASYGASFADFVEQFPPAQQLPYLADICRLCWAYDRLLPQLPDDNFDIQSFSALPEAQQAQVKFQLKANALLLSSPYPLLKIRDLCQCESNEETVDLHSGGVNLLLWRADEQVVIDELSADEFTLAQALQSAGTLEQLTALPTLKDINFAEIIPTFLVKQWLNSFSLD